MDALLYRVHVVIDAAMDIVAMLVRDFGYTVQDDYHNISTLEQEGKLPQELAKKLCSLNGMRNAIIHKYNTFEEDTVVDKVSDIKQAITAFLEVVDEHRKTLFGSDTA